MKLVSWFFLCIPLIIFSLWINNYSLRINLSRSLPNTVYLAKITNQNVRDQIVLFSLANSKKVGKIIAGLPGDQLQIVDGTVFINGIQRGEKGKEVDLSYLQISKIPEGYFFALGLSSDSFDSRYEVFGLVPLDSIKERLCPIY